MEQAQEAIEISKEVTSEVIEAPKKHTMRNLKTTDLFKMSKILKKLNIKADVSGLAQEGDSQERAGMKFMFALIQTALENLHLAEDEVNEFLANLIGLDKKAFEELPLEDTLEVIEQFKDQKGVVNFLKRLFD